MLVSSMETVCQPSSAAKLEIDNGEMLTLRQGQAKVGIWSVRDAITIGNAGGDVEGGMRSGRGGGGVGGSSAPSL